jgi:hypothetical protein
MRHEMRAVLRHSVSLHLLPANENQMRRGVSRERVAPISAFFKFFCF